MMTPGGGLCYVYELNVTASRPAKLPLERYSMKEQRVPPVNCALRIEAEVEKEAAKKKMDMLDYNYIRFAWYHSLIS